MHCTAVSYCTVPLKGQKKRESTSLMNTAGLKYAEQRNLNFSSAQTRAWYVQHQLHYLSDGVSFFWNDEGETDYYTFQ